jgi:hypothetical protein
MSQSKRQEWAVRLRRFQQNPSSVEAFCRTEGVSSASFYLWKRRLAAEPTPAMPTFDPLTVAHTPPSPPVEVTFPNGIVIRVPADAQSLRTLFSLAREASC